MTAGTLILGWGNPGRGDDGLGPALTELLGERLRGDVRVESDYQLQVEDASECASHRRVIFVDADRAGPAPFSCHRLAAADSGFSFSSHSVSPGGLLAITRELFGREPEAWLVGVRGYDFDEFHEGLSRRARANLAAAADYLSEALRSGRLDEVPPSPGPVAPTDPLTDRESAP
jgi:hydrogenase maturation protease